jgi:hypothetical protein
MCFHHRPAHPVIVAGFLCQSMSNAILEQPQSVVWLWLLFETI